jgi:hypothetical protein
MSAEPVDTVDTDVTSSNILELSDDLHKIIIDHVLGDGYSKRVLPLLTVSRRWKVSVT